MSHVSRRNILNKVPLAVAPLALSSLVQQPVAAAAELNSFAGAAPAVSAIVGAARGVRASSSVFGGTTELLAAIASRFLIAHAQYPDRSDPTSRHYIKNIALSTDGAVVLNSDIREIGVPEITKADVVSQQNGFIANYDPVDRTLPSVTQDVIYQNITKSTAKHGWELGITAEHSLEAKFPIVTTGYKLTVNVKYTSESSTENTDQTEYRINSHPVFVKVPAECYSRLIVNIKRITVKGNYVNRKLIDGAKINITYGNGYQQSLDVFQLSSPTFWDKFGIKADDILSGQYFRDHGINPADYQSFIQGRVPEVQGTHFDLADGKTYVEDSFSYEGAMGIDSEQSIRTYELINGEVPANPKDEKPWKPRPTMTL